MAFTRIGTMDSHGAPIKRRAIITNSVVSVVMDSIKLASGFAALNTAGAATFGHVLSHATFDGVGLLTSGATGASIGSYAGTYTAASNNQTVGKAVVECDISKFTLYSAEVDAAIGTTTGSNLAGYRMDLVDANTLDESTSATTTAQYGTHGVDQNNTAQAIVNILESSIL